MVTSAHVNQPVALEVKDLHKRFGPLEVLRGVSLAAREGDVISIIGASGSGKSTLQTPAVKWFGIDNSPK